MRIKKIITNIIKRALLSLLYFKIIYFYSKIGLINKKLIEDMILYRGICKTFDWDEDAYFIVEGTNEYSSPNIISTSLSRQIDRLQLNL